jgi:hypothetical protein
MNALLDVLVLELNQYHRAPFQLYIHPKKQQVRFSPVLLAFERLIDVLLKLIAFLLGQLVWSSAEPPSFLLLDLLLSDDFDFTLDGFQFP